MSTAITVDASKLPTLAFGRRSPIWWGVVLFCVMEGVTLAALYFAYLYVRGNFYDWPPSDVIPPLPGALTMGALVVSLVPMRFCRKAAMKCDRKKTRFWLLLASIISVIAVPLRAWQIADLPFLWDENAYASVVWTSIGFHCVEAALGVVENALLTYLLFRGPLEKKHFEDVESNAVFWAFVVLVWVPFGVLFLFDGAIR